MPTAVAVDRHYRRGLPESGVETPTTAFARIDGPSIHAVSQRFHRSRRTRLTCFRSEYGRRRLSRPFEAADQPGGGAVWPRPEHHYLVPYRAQTTRRKTQGGTPAPPAVTARGAHPSRADDGAASRLERAGSRIRLLFDGEQTKFTAKITEVTHGAGDHRQPGQVLGCGIVRAAPCSTLILAWYRSSEDPWPLRLVRRGRQG